MLRIEDYEDAVESNPFDDGLPASREERLYGYEVALYKQYHIASLELALKRNMLGLQISKLEQAKDMVGEMTRTYENVDKLIKVCGAEKKILEDQNRYLEKILNTEPSERLSLLKKIQNEQFDENARLLKQLPRKENMTNKS